MDGQGVFRSFWRPVGQKRMRNITWDTFSGSLPLVSHALNPEQLPYRPLDIKGDRLLYRPGDGDSA